MLDAEFPILEFDPARIACVEPTVPNLDVPEHLVVCFFREVMEEVCKEATAHHELVSEMGGVWVYEIEVADRRLATYHSGVGAPLAAGFLEEAIALGCRKIIVCGGAGVLDVDLALGHVIVPTAAVRDEGTSYHYLPPSREVDVDPKTLRSVEASLRSRHVDYVVGKTWTTDAYFRETPERIARRRAEGCIAVEMEMAAMLAVAKFRGVKLAGLLYAGDTVAEDAWDHRGWHRATSVREGMFWLATELVFAL